MPKWFAPVFAITLLGLAATVAALVIVSSGPTTAGSSDPADGAVSDPLEPDPGLDQFQIPEFTLVDHDGQPVDQTLFEGEITILDFIFTNCPFACPFMGAAMLQLQSELQDTPVRFVSVTVDPERDTPERLRQYAEEGLGGADLTRWRFLTGDRDVIYSMVRDELKFQLATDESRTIPLKQGGEMFNIAHPTKLFLVGPDRQVIALASYNSPAEIAELGVRARAVTSR
ncbi:MAG: SCO family protein [Planctomycetota bacterium]